MTTPTGAWGAERTRRRRPFTRGASLTVGCGEAAAVGPPQPGASTAALSPAPVEAASAAPAAMAAELSRLRAENEQLRAQLSKVAGELRNQREDMKVSQGSPIAAPANLPPRFGSDALLKAVTQSLHEAGLSSAQVTSIDCSEYPCIIYGDGMNARLDSAKLQHAPSFAAYAKDNLRSFGWNMQFPPEGSRSDAPGSSAHWGLVVTPSDDPTPPDEMRKRLEYRTSLMRDAFPDAPGHKAAP